MVTVSMRCIVYAVIIIGAACAIVFLRQSYSFRRSGYVAHLINFRHDCCIGSAMKNCLTGTGIAGFDTCKTFIMDDLDPEFRRNHSEILTQKRGAGYWLWKPYVIYRSLLSMREGDILMYADAGSHFIADASPLIGFFFSSITALLLL